MKILLIIVLTWLISAIHVFSADSALGFHFFHQQLFFIPLVLASFWLGTRAGLLVAVVVSLLYAPPMISRHHESGLHLAVYAQITLYLLVAILMGWLSDRQRKQQELLRQNERITTLAKVASTLSLEVKATAASLERIFMFSCGLSNERNNRAFGQELLRLTRLVEALGHFSPSLDYLTTSTDLNDILQHSLTRFKDEARRRGIKLVSEPEPGSCPWLGDNESIGRIYDSLVENALYFSKRGDAVVLRSRHDRDSYVLEVMDAGPGVAKEDEGKLFTTFFTTKPDGYGLSLASGSKVLRDLGGDLVYRPGEPKGAIFTMIVPKRTIATPSVTRDDSPEGNNNFGGQWRMYSTGLRFPFSFNFSAHEC